MNSPISPVRSMKAAEYAFASAGPKPVSRTRSSALRNGRACFIEPFVRNFLGTRPIRPEGRRGHAPEVCRRQDVPRFNIAIMSVRRVSS